MQQILVYSDSLSWGLIPGTRKRLEFHERWPGVLENELIEKGVQARIVENCLNGRRTAWEDPFKQGRNGLQGIEQVIEMHSPLSLVIVMLGTNDFQSMHPYNAWHASQGMAAIIAAIRGAPLEPDMPIPPIMVISQPPIESPKGSMAEKFKGGETKCIGLAKAYRDLAEELDCRFFEAGEVVSTSEIDGVHLDKGQHLILGKALAEKVQGFFLT